MTAWSLCWQINRCREVNTPTAAPAGGVKCSGIKLAFIGALSGDNGNLGKNMVNGAKVAIDEFNATHPDCQVGFDTSYDSQGDPAQATPLASKIVNDASIVGLIGPGFSGESKATMPTFEAAGLPMITPGATNAKLSTNGWKMFHRILANDDKQAPGVVTLITGTIKGAKVGVIDDASDYGKGLADAVRAGLGAANVANAQIDPKAADFSAAIQAMKSADGKIAALGLTDEQAVGAAIVRSAVTAPIKQIAENAGLEGGVMVQRVEDSAGVERYEPAADRGRRGVNRYGDEQHRRVAAAPLPLPQRLLRRPDAGLLADHVAGALGHHPGGARGHRDRGRHARRPQSAHQCHLP